MELEKLFPENLYHSYVIEGDSTCAIELLGFLEDRGEIEKLSQDVICQNYESFTIDDSHEIKNWHSQLGVTTRKKVCIISAKFINREAEQALLKIIEEPGINTHYFIIVPDVSLLLPTIISRVHVVKMSKRDDGEIEKDILSFIESKPKDRIEIIAKIVKEKKEESTSGYLRSYATIFVNHLEIHFYKKFKEKKGDSKIRFILDELQKSRNYLSTAGASVKMILEHLALII